MGCGSPSGAPPMIETLSGTSAGSATELKMMNSPRRSIFASSEIFIGGSIGNSPSPCHSPISGSNCFIVSLLSHHAAHGCHAPAFCYAPTRCRLTSPLAVRLRPLGDPAGAGRPSTASTRPSGCAWTSSSTAVWAAFSSTASAPRNHLRRGIGHGPMKADLPAFDALCDERFDAWVEELRDFCSIPSETDQFRELER